MVEGFLVENPIYAEDPSQRAMAKSMLSAGVHVFKLRDS